MRRLPALLGRIDFPLRDAARTAIVMPATFAFAELVLGDAQMALFAAFGSMAMLVFVDFGGLRRARLTAYLGLALAGLPLIVLGTLCSRDPWAAAAAMALVGFAILFSGVISGHLAAATPAAILAFVLAVMVPAPIDDVGPRLAGWALAAACSILAVMVLWPSRPRDRLRARAADACRALAGVVESAHGEAVAAEAARQEAAAAVEALRAQFTATPYRPSGVAGPTAELAHLITDLSWVTPLALAPPAAAEPALEPAATELRAAVVALLRASAAVLDTRRDGGAARAELDALHHARAALADAFVHSAEAAIETHDGRAFARLLDETFQLRMLSYTAWQLGGHALRACGVAIPDRDEPDEQPVAGALASVAVASEYVGAHVSMQSVWLRNSARGAIALAAAVLVGQLLDVQHAFWVVLGTLSVLRSHALDTGATVIRALAGTLAGIVAGGLLVYAIGSDEALLWLALPPATLLAAYAPRAVSFAAGQAAFSLLVIVLFNLVEPSGWTVGLLRIEDVAIGCGVSLAVGVLFWPRGAGAVLRAHLADAYAQSIEDVVTTVGALLDERTSEQRQRATDGALAAGRRLDAAFRQFLAERSSARASFEELSLLVAGAARVRRAATMLRSGRALWHLGPLPDDDTRRVLDARVEALRTWFLAFAASLDRAAPPPAAQSRDATRVRRGLRQVQDAVASGDPEELPDALGTAWASRHLDALRGAEPQLAHAATVLLDGHAAPADAGRS